MKKLINLRCYVSVNGEKYCDTSIWKRLRYIEVEKESIETITSDWQSAYEAVANKQILNAYTGETFWKKRPTIVIHYGEIYRQDCSYTEKEFKSLKYKWVAEDVKNNYTIKELVDELPAEQFCEWIKDQNVNISLDIREK